MGIDLVGPPADIGLKPVATLLRPYGTALWLAATLLASATTAAQEPPGMWFLTAGDEVRLAIGGSGGAPPRGAWEELLGWGWSDGGAAVRRFPGLVAARPRPGGPEPRSWHADGRRIGVPRLGIGPGRELLLLGDDEPSTAAAMRWAELLDGVEAAYRHSAPGLADAERRGVIEVGRAGSCAVRSLPVEADAPGWSPLTVDGRVAGSRRGPIEIQRFLRLLDGPSDCGGRRLDLGLIPAPRSAAPADPYLMTWTDLELQPVGFLDLEPTPRAPAVRTLARPPGSAREQINVADWPATENGAVDLCRAPFMDTLCLKDLRIREQLATAAVSEPEVADRLVEGCRAFFDRLGDLPSPHPCSDPGAWRDQVGIYRTGYTGELPLREQPRLISRVNDAGEVQWLWPAGAGGGRPLQFPLADGTRVALAVPAAAPAEIPAIAARRPPTGPEALAPEPGTPVSAATQPTATIVRRPDGTANRRRRDPDSGPPARRAHDSPPARRGQEARRPSSRPAASPPESARADLPGTVPSTPPATSVTAGPPSGPAADGSATEPSGEVEAPAVQPPAEPTAGAGIALPPTAKDRLLWPLALAALAATAAAALLLRGQRALARSRRRARSAGLVAEEPATDLWLDPGAAGTATARLAATDEEDDRKEAEPVELEPPIETRPIEARPIEARLEPPAPIAKPEGSPIALLEPPELTTEPEPPAIILPLEPPELTAAPELRSPLAEEWHTLPTAERREIDSTLAAVDHLGRWIDCLLPVLDDLEHGRGELPGVDHLPAPARREWRQSAAALRQLTGVDLDALRHLRTALDGSPAAEQSPEARSLEAADLLDADRGPLRQRLRRHLLAPGEGRLQRAVLALQYLIEAFPIEHLERHERQAYRATLRRRLEGAGLSTRFHDLVGKVAAGLGWQYRRARYYKARLDQPGAEQLRQAQDPISLSDRVGYPAGTEAGTVVRLSELFLLDPADGSRASGRALVDGA